MSAGDLADKSKSDEQQREEMLVSVGLLLLFYRLLTWPSRERHRRGRGAR